MANTSEDGPVVSSYNEWDPLQEVIVGSALGASFPANEPNMAAMYSSTDVIYKGDGWLSRLWGRLTGSYRDGQFFGRAYLGGEKYLRKAQAQLDNLAHVLANEGITVRRPEYMDFEQPIVSGDGWTCPVQNAAVCPRDNLIVVGDQIIEATMASRSRVYETSAYRSLLKDYWRRGAKWVSAPRAQLIDACYNPKFPIKEAPDRLECLNDPERTHLTEYEPIWEAADCVRMGKDMFFQKSLTTNHSGIEWFRRHVGPEYRVHTVSFPKDPAPVHIDASFTPLKPYFALTNPQRRCDKQSLFQQNGWTLVDAPVSDNVDEDPGRCSWWLNMNVLSVDPNTVCVEASEKGMIRMLQTHGFRVLEVPFQDVYELGGSFHCATIDVRRSGTLESYFPELDKVEDGEKR